MNNNFGELINRWDLNLLKAFSGITVDQEWAKLPGDNRQTDKLAFRPRNWLSSTAHPPFTFQKLQNIASNDAQPKTFQNISDQEIVIYLSKLNNTGSNDAQMNHHFRISNSSA